MIAIDTNILVYAHRPETPFHARASDAFDSLARDREPFGIPVHCLIEFSAVVSHPKIWKQPSSPTHIRNQIEAWLSAPFSELLTEGRDFVGTFLEVLETAKPSGGVVHDARIAACVMSNHVSTFWTADRDFSRYPIRMHNPLR